MEPPQTFDGIGPIVSDQTDVHTDLRRRRAQALDDALAQAHAPSHTVEAAEALH